MKNKTVWYFIILALIVNFVMLIIALTNTNHDNPLKEYRLVLGISFVAIGGFVRNKYKRVKQSEN